MEKRVLNEENEYDGKVLGTYDDTSSETLTLVFSTLVVIDLAYRVV